MIQRQMDYEIVDLAVHRNQFDLAAAQQRRRQTKSGKCLCRCSVASCWKYLIILNHQPDCLARLFSPIYGRVN